VAVAVVCTGIVFHEYVYGEVPPEGIAVALPVVLPKQRTLTWVVVTDRPAAGCKMVTEAVFVQELASVTVTT
jgi:hypothetical protein